MRSRQLPVERIKPNSNARCAARAALTSAKCTRRGRAQSPKTGRTAFHAKAWHLPIYPVPIKPMPIVSMCPPRQTEGCNICFCYGTNIPSMPKKARQRERRPQVNQTFGPMGELPRDFDAFQGTVKARRDALPKRLVQVADYALHHPDEIAFGQVASIAAAAGVQPSTLVRFAHHFGFGGFSDMQSIFRDRLRNRNVSYEERIAILRGVASGSPELAILNGFL